MKRLFFRVLALPLPKRKWRNAVRELGENHLEQKFQHFMNMCTANMDICKIPPARGFLRTIQMANLKMLTAFDRLCRENGLEYFMIGGAIIGKIRHNGFIPWDDDIDLGLMAEDYMKLLEILKNKLPNNEYDLLFYGYWNIPKIVHKKTGLFIDIFRFDYLDNDNFDRKDIEARKEKFEKAYRKEFLPYDGDPDKRIFPVITSSTDSPEECLKKWQIIFDVTKRQENLFNEIIRNGKPANKLGGIVHFSGISKHNEIHKNNIIVPLKRLEFCGQNLLFPNNLEDYASTVWGDIYEFPKDMFTKHGKIEFDFEKHINMTEMIRMNDDEFYEKMSTR